MSASKRGHTKITRLLLNRNADPNQARTDTGRTPLMLAAINGHLEVAQLLVVHGGCMAARTTTGSSRSERTTLCSPGGSVPSTAGTRLGSRWGAACMPMPAPSCGSAARSRWTPRPQSGSQWPGLPQTRASCRGRALAAADALWEGSLPPCTATSWLSKQVAAAWSPAAHELHHAEFRRHIHAVFLMSERLRRGHSVGPSICHEGSLTYIILPVLPAELWMLVCQFFVPADWDALPQRTSPVSRAGRAATP